MKHGEEEGPAREESPLAESVHLEDRLSSIQKAELLSQELWGCQEELEALDQEKQKSEAMETDLWKR